MSHRSSAPRLGRRFLVTACLVLLMRAQDAGQARAAVTVSGSTSSNPTSTNADPIIGVSALGRLTIDAGSLVVSDVAILGDQPDGIGLVTVTDFNAATALTSTWTTNSLTVADEGTGRLEIRNGGIVNVDFAGTPGAGDFVIGNQPDSVGTVIVSGLGSLLRFGDESTVGVEGSGTLRIENDGYVIATNGSGSDLFTIGLHGRVELAEGRLRTDSFINGGLLSGTGRIDSEIAILNAAIGRFEANSGDRLVLNASVTNRGEIIVRGGEIEFQDPVTSSTESAITSLQNGTVRFPATGFGYDSTAGTLATTSGTNDIFGTVRLQGPASRIVAGGESTAVFHQLVTNNGGTIEVFPGSTALFLQGLATTGAGAVLSVRLEEVDGKADAGLVQVVGDAQLAGSVAVSAAPGLIASAGDTFPILTAVGSISGSMALASAPALAGGMRWELVIQPNSVVLSVVATGDYNGNGVVDSADYVLWRNQHGQTGAGLAADGNGSGTVDRADYDIWRGRFGNVVGVNSAAAAVAVPEPVSVALLCTGAAVLLGCRRKLHWYNVV